MGKLWHNVTKCLGIHLFLRGMTRWHPVVRMLIGGLTGAYVGVAIGVGIAIVFAPDRTGAEPTTHEWYIFMVCAAGFWGLIVGGIPGAIACLFRRGVDRACILAPTLIGAAIWIVISVLSYERPPRAADGRPFLALQGLIFGGGLGFLAGLVLVLIVRLARHDNSNA